MQEKRGQTSSNCICFSDRPFGQREGAIGRVHNPQNQRLVSGRCRSSRAVHGLLAEESTNFFVPIARPPVPRRTARRRTTQFEPNGRISADRQDEPCACRVETQPGRREADMWCPGGQETSRARTKMNKGANHVYACHGMQPAEGGQAVVGVIRRHWMP